jgi:hypothetical protein
MAGLPAQKVPLSLKTKDWKRDTMTYFERLSYTSPSGNRTTNFNKLVNYDLYNGKFNKADLEYVCNPLGLSDNEFPATLQHYDVISPAINLLIGEEVKRPDNFMVVSESPEDINRKNKELLAKINSSLEQTLMASVDPSTIDPNNPPPTPEEILKYEKYNPSDLVESQANKILKSLRKKLNTKEIFKKGWKDSLIAGEEIYWTGISNNEPVLRRCNPCNITVVLDNDSDFIDDAVAVVETRMMSPATIVDEFGDKLSPAEVDLLEDYTRAVSNNYAQYQGVNPTFVLNSNASVVDIGGSLGNSSSGYNALMIRVVRIEWKSFCKRFKLTYTDEDEIPQELTVDETFNLKVFRNAYPDAKTEEYWITEAWEGIKIGTDLYIEANAKHNQRRRMDNPYACKLGYTGLIYNATNSVSVSLIDRLKPYQYLYNIISYRLELAFASDMGKIMLMDLAQIPRSEGIDIEKWMYYLRAMKIAFVNSFEEGKKGPATGKFSSFNQFQSIDMSLSNVIQQYIQTLEYIKGQVAFISGVSPQRLGAIASNELVGNVQRSVEQSALITEFMFDSHNEVKRRVYTALIEAAKVAYRDGLVTQYVLDDMGIEMLKLDEFELENSEFNTYVSNSNKDAEVIQTLKQLSQVALQSDKADLSTMIDTIINENPRDIIRILKRSEEEKYSREADAQKQQLAQQQQEVAANQAMHQEEIAERQKDRDVTQYVADTNNQTKIQIAEISALGFSKETDSNTNGIPDVMEVAAQSLAEREASSKAFLEHGKLLHEKNKHQSEMALKEKELKSKTDIEDKKLQMVREQNANQEKLANQKAALDKEMMNKKIEIEKIKARKSNKPK